MKKNLFLSLIVIVLGVSSAFAYDLANVDWRNIHLYSCNNLEFKKTIYQQFLHRTKGFKRYANQGSNIILGSIKESEKYSQIRAGFENNKLSWIEFNFKKPLIIEEALYYFDNPISISKDYNKKYDYYNYDYFTLTVDKEHKEVYSLNLFDYSNLKVGTEKISSVLPDINNLDTFSALAPGDVTEKDFISYFPFLKPYKNNRYSADSNYIIEGIVLAGNNDISKAEYVFKNGILSFICIYPKNNNYSKFKEKYGSPLTFKTISDELTTCQYSNFSVIIDKNNLIKNIGVFSSI